VSQSHLLAIVRIGENVMESSEAKCIECVTANQKKSVFNKVVCGQSLVRRDEHWWRSSHLGVISDRSR